METLGKSSEGESGRGEVDGVAKRAKSVHPIGNAISHSTNRGFKVRSDGDDGAPCNVVPVERRRTWDSRLGRHLSRLLPDMKPVPAACVRCAPRIQASDGLPTQKRVRWHVGLGAGSVLPVLRRRRWPQRESSKGFPLDVAHSAAPGTKGEIEPSDPGAKGKGT